jgi:hypothetical protein
MAKISNQAKEAPKEAEQPAEKEGTPPPILN